MNLKTPVTLACFACALSFGSPKLAEAAWVDPALREVLEKASPQDEINLFVVLEEQLDLQAVIDEVREGRGTLADRHYEVVSRAQALASTSQGPLIAWLVTQQKSREVTSFKVFWITNAVAVTARPTFVETLVRRPEVRSIFPDYPIENITPASELTRSTAAAGGVENGVAVTGAPELWAMGIDGTGTLASHQDTGVDGTHPALAERWRGLEPGVDPHAAWFDPNYGTIFPTDSDIHGTHTMGTIVGDDGEGNQVGMAPGAQWISAKTIDIPGGNIFSDAVEGFQWAADPDGDPATIDDVPDVMSNSWGLQVSTYGSCLTDFNAAIDTAEAAGVVVVFAAGNEGSAGLRSPANRIATDYNTFAVGAVNQDNTTIASFSSRGPSDCDHSTIKPEISAVGTSVRSSLPGGGYGYLDGTSMACPHVAGAVLLLRQQWHSLREEGPFV